jgi:hypothetical protein
MRRRVEERVPAAVCRFGDGEGRLLTADPGDPASMQEAIRKLKKETGLLFSPEDALEVKALVMLAFREADVIAIRPDEWFSEETKKWVATFPDLHAEHVAAGRRPAALAPRPDFDSLPELLAGRRISAISCRDVKSPLEADWKAEDVAVYQVPSQHMVRDVDGPFEEAMHDVPIWPDAHARVCSQLTVRERGEVFLVGAGVFGKDLCVRVRELGGIGLDVGSMLDQVAGKITRGPERRALELRASGMSIDDIAAHMEDAYGVEVGRDQVLQLLGPS